MTNWIYNTNSDNTARYTLGKHGERVLFCIGINPSTATPDNLDPTLKRVQALANANNYDGWIMLNVYPQRATDPNDMHPEKEEILHQENIKAIQQIAKKYGSIDILAAWGTNIKRRDYLRNCLNDITILLNKRANWLHLGELTKRGHPRHPLYVPRNITFNKFDIHSYLRN